MSKKELRAAEAVAKVNAGKMTAVEAAAALGVTDRTVRRMKRKMAGGDIAALAHKGRGLVGNRAMPKAERRKMEKLIRERYPDFRPGLTAEKLRELHDIDRDPKTVASVMASLGLWVPRRGKAAAAQHRQWRERRARRGELVQYDGSYHQWFEARLLGPDGLPAEVCLLASIDDATGTVPEASFAEHEGVLPTLAFWRRYAERHGLPEALYLDKFSTYRVNDGVAAENQDTRTQFGRVMALLGVRVIFANSPQAKGRVERLFQTLQDRLVKELRLRKISTVEAANRFLRDEFLPDFNRRFGRPAREAGDRHRPLSTEERRRLGRVFCREEWRTLTNDYTVPHGRLWYQLLKTPRVALRPRDRVCVRTEPDGSVTLWVRERRADYRVVEKGRGSGLEKDNR